MGGEVFGGGVRPVHVPDILGASVAPLRRMDVSGLEPALFQHVAARLRTPPALASLREDTLALLGRDAYMVVSEDEAVFLGWLARLLGCKRALEVGTFTGMTTLALLLALPEEARVVTCDLATPEATRWTDVARAHWERAKVAHRVDLRLAPAADTLAALVAARRDGTEEPFDLCFIDADKSAQVDYYEACVELLRPGGVVAVDNIFWEGKVADIQYQDSATLGVRATLDRMASDERIAFSVVGVGDGVALGLKL